MKAECQTTKLLGIVGTLILWNIIFVAKFVETTFMLFSFLFTGTTFGTTSFCGAVAIVKGPFGGNSSKILFKYKDL